MNFLLIDSSSSKGANAHRFLHDLPVELDQIFTFLNSSSFPDCSEETPGYNWSIKPRSYKSCYSGAKRSNYMKVKFYNRVGALLERID